MCLAFGTSDDDENDGAQVKNENSYDSGMDVDNESDYELGAETNSDLIVLEPEHV